MFLFIMVDQKQIITYESDLETMMSAASLFAQVSNGTLPSDQALNAYDDFHKVQEPMLRNYKEVVAVREILDNFDKKLRENYHGQF